MTYALQSTIKLRTIVGSVFPGMELLVANQSPMEREEGEEQLTSWVRVLVNTASANYASIGNNRLNRVLGNVTVQLFNRLMEGDLVSLRQADKLIEKLDGVESNDEEFKIRLGLPYVAFSGLDVANPRVWYQTNVIIPYTIDYENKTLPSLKARFR